MTTGEKKRKTGGMGEKRRRVKGDEGVMRKIGRGGWRQKEMGKIKVRQLWRPPLLS